MKSDREISQSRVRVLDLPDGLDDVFPAVKELRPHLDLNDFKRLVMLAHAADGYRVVVIDEGGTIVAMMGYRILHDLVHGSHLYVDDLVAIQERRSKGHGAKLLKFAEAEARRLGLTNLRLCTGFENESARRFYAREGWVERSVAFKKKVPTH